MPMHPNRGENHSIEVGPSPVGSEAAAEQSVESPSAQESSPGKRPVQVTSVTPPVDPAALAQSADDFSLPADDSKPTPTSVPATQGSKEGDHIERIWIDKAKGVIAKTQDDPHAQKDAMSKVKAEYIQKRFNKIIRTDDAVSA